MSEMVERVARVMCRLSAGGDFAPPSDIYITANWPAFEGQARAAIEAMREPTNRMVHAGLGYDAEETPPEYLLRGHYRAMIAAALE